MEHFEKIKDKTKEMIENGVRTIKEIAEVHQKKYPDISLKIIYEAIWQVQEELNIIFG